MKLSYFLLITLMWAGSAAAQTDTASYADQKYMQVDNMVVYQRGNGGWPKQISKEKIDYSIWLNKSQQEAAKKAAAKADDATFDNSATTKEIRALLKAYKETKNAAYLASAEKGIEYIYKAQYANGGWPQFYPDFSKYHGQITFNDNAMINVMNLLLDLQLGVNDLDLVNADLKAKAEDAVKRGISIILKTQLTYNNKLSAWCTQYDPKKLRPETARAYELPSTASSESVGIVKFLMRIKNPSPEIKTAIKSAVAWLESVKIVGYKFVDVPDPSNPGAKNKVLLIDENSTIWARFYDLDTNKPFFCGRDGEKKNSVAEIEAERRNGYGWYGNWPEKLLQKDYPKWLKENGE